MENMLRGSLTSTTDAKGVLGFKGERGYSNYEIYVKNGGTLTEEEWLEHFGVDLTGYAKTTEVSAMLDNEIGDLSELETENKDNTVDAINELKGNIDTLDERGIYSTTEKVIGTWIDGKPLYRKVIDFGTLPNTTFKRVNHYISNLKRFISIKGMAYRSMDGTYFPLPYSAVGEGNNIQIVGAPTDIAITTGIDRTNLDECYITIEYTKTTD